MQQGVVDALGYRCKRDLDGMAGHGAVLQCQLGDDVANGCWCVFNKHVECTSSFKLG